MFPRDTPSSLSLPPLFHHNQLIQLVIHLFRRSDRHVMLLSLFLRSMLLFLLIFLRSLLILLLLLTIPLFPPLTLLFLHLMLLLLHLFLISLLLLLTFRPPTPLFLQPILSFHPHLLSYCIVLYLSPVLNPMSYDGARLYKAPGRPMLVIGRDCTCYRFIHLY